MKPAFPVGTPSVLCVGSAEFKEAVPIPTIWNVLPLSRSPASPGCKDKFSHFTEPDQHDHILLTETLVLHLVVTGISPISGCWKVWLIRVLREHEIIGSNPIFLTIIPSEGHGYTTKQ